MMKFTTQNLVIIDSMSRDEARALIYQVVNKFKLGDLLDGD